MTVNIEFEFDYYLWWGVLYRTIFDKIIQCRWISSDASIYSIIEFKHHDITEYCW